MKDNTDIYNGINLQMLKSENMLKSYASKSSDAIRLNPNNDDIRLNYARDIDRIVHSLAYTRYLDKTQVYSSEYNYHITKRMTHVQFVSRASKTIARALGLNEDLCEAIALGHDVGHVPFGHEGEHVLNKISMRELNRIFAHNVQSAKLFMNIENFGNGLNLTIQTLDGILCHNGEFISEKYEPKKKTKEDYLSDYNKCYEDKEVLNKLRPMTLEGCVVRISDIIGYIGKDIEDAIILNVIKREDLPMDIVKVLGNNNVKIMNTLILDIIENSYQKQYISMSDEKYNALAKLRKFNFDNIYSKSIPNSDVKIIIEMFESLFYYYLEQIKKGNENSDIYTKFLNHMNDKYLASNYEKNLVIDYIAGMTDGYMKLIYLQNIKKG